MGWFNVLVPGIWVSDQMTLGNEESCLSDKLCLKSHLLCCSVLKFSFQPISIPFYISWSWIQYCSYCQVLFQMYSRRRELQESFTFNICCTLNIEQSNEDWPRWHVATCFTISSPANNIHIFCRICIHWMNWIKSHFCLSSPARSGSRVSKVGKRKSHLAGENIK